MAFKQALQYETIRSRDTAGAAAYVTLGTQTTNPSALIKIVNLSNKDLLVSVDGINDHDICPSTGFFLYDVTTNAPSENFLFVPGGRQYYVRTADGLAGTGLVYLVVQYVPSV